MEKKKIWYVCYGSNLLLERFEHYIKGGTCRYNNKEYKGCEDKTMPEKSAPCEIPYDMYYGKDSLSWGGSVSFLDDSKAGKAYGRAYLVTEEQFEKIWEQEGKKSLYSKKISLEPIDGIEAYTFTHKEKLGYSRKPSLEYLFVLAMGLKETYPDMSNLEILDYLKKTIACSAPSPRL